MRSARTAALLLFGVYVPSTAVVGLLMGSFQAPGIERSFSYEFFLWFVVAVQLLVPTLLAFVFALVLLRLCAPFLVTDSSAILSKLIAAVFVGVTLPAVQALVWGGQQLSFDWFAVAVCPALLLGFFVGARTSQSSRVRSSR